MPFKQGLSAGDVLSQFVGLNDGFGIVGPRNEVAVVSQKPLQAIRILQNFLAVTGLQIPGVGGPVEE